jgi:hypothetical protein
MYVIHIWLYDVHACVQTIESLNNNKKKKGHKIFPTLKIFGWKYTPFEGNVIYRC